MPDISITDPATGVGNGAVNSRKTTETPVEVGSFVEGAPKKNKVDVGWTHYNVWVLFRAFVYTLMRLLPKETYIEIFKEVSKFYDLNAEGTTSKDKLIEPLNTLLFAESLETGKGSAQAAGGKLATTTPIPARPSPLGMPAPMPPPAATLITVPTTTLGQPLRQEVSLASIEAQRQLMVPIEPYVQALLVHISTLSMDALYKPNVNLVHTIGDRRLITLYSATGRVSGVMKELVYAIGDYKSLRDVPQLVDDAEGRPYVRSAESPRNGLAAGESRWIRIFELHEGMKFRYMVHDVATNRDDPKRTLYYRVMNGVVTEVSEFDYRS